MTQQGIDLNPYTETYTLFTEATQGLAKEQLNWKPAADKWSVTEVLSHLADHSIVFSFRLRKLIAETEVQLPAFPQDPWVHASRANDGDAEDYLHLFGTLVAFNRLLFQRFAPDDWKKTGTNAKGETVSVEQSYHAFIKHVHVHVKQIERIKNAL